jgi:hypothetical protein
LRKALLTLIAGGLAVFAFAGTASASSSCYLSPRGCVSVRGHYKPSTGHYVKPYVRNYPGYGSYHVPSFHVPSYHFSY